MGDEVRHGTRPFGSDTHGAGTAVPADIRQRDKLKPVWGVQQKRKALIELATRRALMRGWWPHNMPGDWMFINGGNYIAGPKCQALVRDILREYHVLCGALA